MTRLDVSAVISDLQSASEASTVLATLRIIKNQVVGHGERKRKWVQAGLGHSLACIIASLGDTNTSPLDKGKGTKHQSGRDHEEEAQIQALIILASLAQCKCLLN